MWIVPFFSCPNTNRFPRVGGGLVSPHKGAFGTPLMPSARTNPAATRARTETVKVPMVRNYILNIGTKEAQHMR
jgi:hypothetical protein